MSFLALLYICFSILIADNRYCSSSAVSDKSIISSRTYYNIGDTISNDDQMFPYTVCYSDGNYNIGSAFRLSDYSGEIILISMNATW